MNKVLCFSNSDITVTQNIGPKEKECPCCGKKFYIEPFVEQPLCNACYKISVKMLFSGNYDNLTATEFKKAVREKILEGGNL